MIRVAFTLIGSKKWTGGYNYLLNLLTVITTHHPGAVQPVLLCGTDASADDMRPFRSLPGLVILSAPTLNADRRFTVLLRSLLLGVDPAIRRLLNQQRIDIVFENAQFYGWRLGVPVIAWIPDLQHRELPHLFSYAAWCKRELGFRTQIAARRTIMVSSYDALSACERHYPGAIGRVHVVRFAVKTSRRPSATEVLAVRDFYGLPERYFYLPNQFWQHKNHLLVIDALEILQKSGQSINVVASGKQLDPYRPDYFGTFRKRLEAAGLSDRLRLLGLIPYEHVAPLMLGSLAVLNPSQFEGWSTTVEEARALEVPLVLSDLPVHKEQATGIARFFDRKSAASLAETLRSIWQGQEEVPTVELPLSFGVYDPAQRFANDFVDLLKRVMTHQSQTQLGV